MTLVKKETKEKRREDSSTTTTTTTTLVSSIVTVRGVGVGGGIKGKEDHRSIFIRCSLLASIQQKRGECQ